MDMPSARIRPRRGAAIRLSLLGLAILLTTQVHGQTVPSPGTAPPRFVVVSAINQEDGTIAYMEIRSLVVENQGAPRVIVDVSMRQLSLKSWRIWTAGGKELTQAAGLRRLKPGMTVLISQHGLKPDPAFLRVLKEDTLVLVEPLTK